MVSFWCLLPPFFLFYAFAYGDSTLFPVPENLKSNVKFWIKVYTEISQDQGLLHDSEFPQIVYEEINTGGLHGREPGRNLESLRKEIISAIIKVRTGKRSTWGAIEKRIDSLFYSNPGSMLDSAEYRVRFQRGQKDQFLRGLYRSGAYIDTIKTILARYGVPSELAYLPHVESSFDPFITSKVGAVGIWQFMPATAKQFLLRVDRSIDERRDPILSTDAAARVLSRNYRHLKNWPLAITAYNYGLPGMLRAVEATGSNDPGVVIDKHKSPSFRFASRNFYSCFLAALEVVQNYRKYFGEIEFEGRMSVRDIFLSQDLSPVQIARILGITTDEFFLLNPGMSKDLRQVSRGTTIRVSDTFTTETLEQRVAYYYDSVSASQAELEPVAAVNPVTVETIPVSTPVFDADIYDFALRQTGSEGIHEITVLPNETVGAYAAWLGIPEIAVLRLNKMNESIKVGQALKIPVPFDKKEGFVNARRAFHQGHEERFFARYRITKVKPKIMKHGENIWTLCRGKTEIPIWLLRKFNRDLDLEKLRPGTVVIFPVITPL